MLTPSWAILIICSIRLKSFKHSPLIRIARLLLPPTSKSLILLKKWYTSRAAVPRCTKRLVMLSNFFAVVVPFCIISPMMLDHAMNLFFCSLTSRRLVSMSHPRIVFCSASLASACSLFLASISSRGIGSFACLGHAHVSMARRVACSHQIALSVPSITMVA